MKKLIICLLAIVGLYMNHASAQQKGDFYLGGNLGVNVTSVSVSGESASAAEFGIAPEIGYFVTDRFMLGLGLSYNIASGDAATHTFTIGPKFSYYAPICDNLYYTPSLEVAFAYGSSSGLNMSGFGLGLSCFGLEFRPSKHLGFSASILSVNYVMLSRYGVTINNVGLNISASPTIGFKYYF